RRGGREAPRGETTRARQAEVADSRTLAVDQRRGAEPRGEAPELAARGRALREIHEVHRDPPLREEAERLAGVLAVGEAEDLDVHRQTISGSARTPAALTSHCHPGPARRGPSAPPRRRAGSPAFRGWTPSRAGTRDSRSRRSRRGRATGTSRGTPRSESPSALDSRSRSP